MHTGIWRNLGLDFLFGTLLVGAWYYIALRLNRRRSMKVVYWIDEAISGTARIAGLEWLSASHFLVRLRFPEQHFKRAQIHVRLHPWELPLRWVMTKFRHTQETLTFEADLATPPTFNMQVQGQRWTGRSGTSKKIPNLSTWQVEKLGPFVVTTRPDWEPNVVNTMDTLSCSAPCEFLQVTFNPDTPNFTATLPLDSVRPGAEYRATLFDTMRELAIGESPSRT
jgi:hypothetical protein